MIEYVLIIIGVILGLLGLTELVHGIKLFCVSPKHRARTYSVIILNDYCAEQQLNYAVEQFMWMGTTYADKIIAVISDLSEEKRSSCCYIAKKYGITFCEADQLSSEILRIKQTDNDIKN